MPLCDRGGSVSFLLLMVVAFGLTVLPSRASARTLGVDVSSWQFDMHWETAYDQGVRFAFVRSSRGGTTLAGGRVVDERFVENMQEIDALAQQGKQIYAGAYHYARPDTIGSVVNETTIRAHAQDQAQHFYNIAGDYMTPGWMRPVLDLEADGGVSDNDPNTPDTRNLTPAEMTLWVHSFMDQINNLAGVTPLIYLNTYYATHQIEPSVAQYDLWLARYNSEPFDPWTDNPQTPPGSYPNPYGVWNDPIGSSVPSHDSWSFWQYTSSGDGATYGASSARIDLDMANGDLDFVRSFVIPPQPIPEPGVGLALVAGLGMLRRRR